MEDTPFIETITLSVFVSSPGDLGNSRSVARQIINQMSGRVIEGKKVIFRPMLYEDHTAAMVGYSPQQSVDYFMGCANEVSIYVGMFWSRMGSPVVVKGREHPSGTRYEFDKAYRGLRTEGQPLMLLYRCVLPPLPISTAEDQSEVEAFFDGFKGLHPQYQGFPQSFKTEDEFAALLMRDLDQVARHVIYGTFTAKQDDKDKGHELAELVVSVRNWLASFEDMFGKDLKDDQERERDRLFPVHFRPLSAAEKGSTAPESELIPRRDESLMDVFDRWDRKLLMVGEMGTGKTFAMLRLMQDLADRAYLRRGEPVPVFFNLSSWSETYHESARPPSMLIRLIRKLFPPPKKPMNTLDQWIEDQMVRNYSMQRKAAKRLLGNNSVIICLDGLDELGAGVAGDKTVSERASRMVRDACVKAINGTLSNRSVRMILCCREETYHELTWKPQMGRPLQTQLLTNEEVLEGLRHWPRLEGLKTVIVQSPVLLERARVALFVSMMRVAYQDMDAERIRLAVTLPKLEWEKHLMDHYVDQCMRQAPPECIELNKDLIPSCLSWMAQMPDNDFLLDDLQPSMLRMDESPQGVEQWACYRRMSVLLLALSLMVIETFPPGLSLGIEYLHHEGWLAGLMRCLTMWILSALILSPLYVGAFSARGWVRFGLCFGFAWALDSATCIYLAVHGWNEPDDGTWQGAFHMFRTALPCACIFFMLMGMQFIERLAEHKRCYSTRPGIEWHEIQPIEPMSWCWIDSKSYWRGGWIGLIVGPLVLAIALMAGEGMRGTVACVLVTLLVTMFSGLSGTGVARVSIEPNQGIARSLRHALLMTKVFVLCGSASWGLIYYLRHDDWVHGILGVCMGLTLAFSFYVFGGWPVIQQFCLGTVLNRQGKLPTWICWPPWRATVEFLDDLVRYKLLRRSAGGYMFRHQSLREYYRTLSDKNRHVRMDATD